MLADQPTARMALEQLRAKGISLALDDFGSGYSNLSYLTNLKVDVLKIDRAFAADLDSNPATRAMIRSFTGLAHELGVSIVVEGVETIDQLCALRDFGCDYAQGYLFAKPLGADAFAALLHQQARPMIRPREDGPARAKLLAEPCRLSA